MKIAYICQYFVPEPSAPSVRISELAQEWVKDGHEVTVLTGMPNHPNGIVLDEYRGKIIADEKIADVNVLRSWLYATPNEGILRKTLSHLSFMISTVMLSLPRLNKIDVIIVSSPTFLSAFAGLFISKMRRVPFVFEVRDLWPAIFVDLGILSNVFLIRVLESWEMFLYTQAALVVTVTKSFRNKLIERGLPAEKIAVVSNGAAVNRFNPGDKNDHVRSDLGISSKFVVSYIGAHGISQGVATIMEAATTLKYRDDIVFMLVGDGAMKKDMVTMKNDHNLHNVVMLPAQSKERIPDLYCASDVCIVPLRDIPLFDSFVPSKMFEIMSCGIPIIGSVNGEAREILELSGSAMIISPESVSELADSILWMVENPQKRRIMGTSGRTFVCEHYDRTMLAKKYVNYLKRIVL
jgi:glycosyltransferase involved in cell wall biosynthesis